MFGTKQLDTSSVAVFFSAFLKSRLFFLFFLQFFFVGILSAEGTKQVSPTENDWVILNLKNGFASYNSGGTGKGIAIEILDSSEEVYIALSRLANGNFRDVGDSPYEFRIRDSVGNIVHGPFTVDPSNVNGDIYNEVIAGPDLGSGIGYDVSDPAFHFSPSFVGTFYVEFRMPNTFAPSGYINEGPAWWDFTVIDAVGDTKLGRLWSKNWGFRTTCDNCPNIFSQPFNGEVYALTNDGFVHQVDFKGSGFKGLSFALAFNRTGPGSTGDIEVDRQSVNGLDASNPEFKIFFNDPDSLLYEEPSIGGLLDGPDLSNGGQCDTTGLLCFTFNISQPGQIQLVLDLDGPDSTYTPGTADLVLLEHYQAAGGIFEVCINWDNRDGLGRPVDLTASIPTIVSYAQGIIHFMFYDVENNNPGFKIAVIHPASAVLNDKLYYDDSQLNSSDNDSNLDGDNNAMTGTNPPLIELNGCPTPCHAWNAYNSQAIGYGERNTINSWWSGNINYINLLARPICRGDTVLVPKSVAEVSNASSGMDDRFDVTFEIIIENTGTTSFDSIQLSDDLAATFGAGFIDVIEPPSVSIWAGNPELPNLGTFPNDIFDGVSGLLDPNDAIKVEFTLELDPAAGGGWDTFNNQAYFFATNEFSNTIAIPTNDPNDSLDNSPTIVALPKIGLAKTILNNSPASSGAANHFDIEYELIIKNLGDTPISGISLMDSLENWMGDAFVQIVNSPVISAASTTTSPGGINTNFTGRANETEILDGNGILQIGETLILNFTAEIAPYEFGTRYDTSGYLANQAIVSGIYSSSIVTDLSDTGIDPSDDLLASGTNPGAFGDSGGTNDPTLFVFEQCPLNLVIAPNPYLDCNSGNCIFNIKLIGDCTVGLSVENPQPGHTYKWYRGNDLLIGETASALSASTINGVSSNIRVEVTNSGGCISSDTIMLSCCILNDSNIEITGQK